VQTYQTDTGEIWHADLYRLSGHDEAFELGLDDAMRTERCLIEWPERFAPDWPDTAVMLRFEPDAEDPETTRAIALWATEDGETLRRVLDAWPAGARA
jgi:tRNA threonylcarbamoyladenosine biosynthesis protein TsaE